MTTTIVSTDGSALSNPNGPMGWGWANHNDRSHDAGGATNGTNQIGELCAVLQALRTHHNAEDLLIETDSQYAINCSTTWVHNWKKNGWRNAAKKPVKNVELIKAIDFEMHNRPGSVAFKWVKGHAGNEFNEIVDDLARGYAGDAQSGAKPGKLPLEGWQSLLNSPYRKGLEVPADVQAQLDGNAGVATATATAPVTTALPVSATPADSSTATPADAAPEEPSAANGYGTLEQLSLFDDPEPTAEPEPPASSPEEDDPRQATLF
ncbi:MAG: ribonuclease HI [Bifidobacteriaceae bacterium]|jgi:ribonuclease HI|nr:ribonuclease HI [Bifidobacteriaceae bacterium]